MASASDPGWFTPTQRRWVAAAVTALSVGVLLTVAVGLFVLLRRFVGTFSGVLWPLAVAGILALMLRPLVVALEVRWRLGRTTAIGLLYALVAAVLLGLARLLLPLLLGQFLDFIHSLPELFRNARDFVHQQFPPVVAFLREQLSDDALRQLGESLANTLRQVASASLPAVETLRDWFSRVAGWAAGLAIIPIYLFFFLASDRDPTRDLAHQLSFVRAEWRDDLIFLIREFAASLVAFFRGQILIGLIMGVLLALGFSLAGISFGLLLGLLLGLLNIIPYFGTILGLATVLPIAYFQADGGWTLVGLAVLAITVVQMIEGYVLTPRIMGRTTGLHPLAIIIAIFFWGTALEGVLGMILAIPLTAFLVVAWRLVKRKYLDRAPPRQD